MTASTRHAIAAVALLGSAAVATACGHNVPVAAPSATKTPHHHAGPGGPGAPTASASASTPGTTPSCATSALRVSVATTQAGAAAGSTYYPIDLTNTSNAPCTLFGYPGVSFVATHAGHGQLGLPAGRNGAIAARLVTLTAGGTAHATLQVAEAGNYPTSACKPVTAHWLKVFPPNQTAAAVVGFTAQVCSRATHLSSGQLSITAVAPGKGMRQ